MELEFSSERDGAFDGRVFVSDLLSTALGASFGGTIRLEHEGRSLVIALQKGRATHVSGDLVEGHKLGELLVSEGKLRSGDLEKAVAAQAGMQPKPLLGALLVRDAKIDPADIKRAVQEQVRRRLAEVLGMEAGTWRVSPGARPPIADVGVQTELAQVFVGYLPERVSERELRAVADRLLGKAVSLRPGGAGPLAADPNPVARTLLGYLSRPRKPDQLERAIKNRRAVRTLLRLLDLTGRLELQPLAKAMPIQGATLLKGQALSFGMFDTAGPEPEPEAPDAEQPKKEGPPKRSETEIKLGKEIRAFHERLGKMNHFEVLGVDQAATSETVRSAFKDLAKKYHPDALGQDVPEDLAAKAREVSSRINEAHQILSKEESRAEYVVLLSDERIKGDAKRVEAVHDAEMKSKMGLVHLRKGEFDKARAMFKTAVDKDGVTGFYKAQLAWAMYADPKFDRVEAFEKGYPMILEALQAKEPSADVHYWAGEMLLGQDRTKEALHHFKATLELNKNHDKAKTQKRLTESRLEREREAAAKKKKSGGFGKLFGKD